MKQLLCHFRSMIIWVHEPKHLMQLMLHQGSYYFFGYSIYSEVVVTDLKHPLLLSSPECRLSLRARLEFDALVSL